VLEDWSVGVLEDWRIGVLECWSVGGLECWSSFVAFFSESKNCFSSSGIKKRLKAIVLFII
jgi:hypothetical protein